VVLSSFLCLTPAILCAILGVALSRCRRRIE
jgi:hypothetical protein